MRYLLPALLTMLGLFLIGFGFLGLHDNFNSSDYYGYGRGSLRVAYCKPVHNYYACTGNFQQHGGMISASDMALQTKVPYPSGSSIEAYIKYDRKDANNLDSNTAKLQTESQRRSFGNNAAYLLSCAIGTVAVLYSLLKLTRIGKRVSSN
jgi:hypothetical protein